MSIFFNQKPTPNPIQEKQVPQPTQQPKPLSALIGITVEEGGTWFLAPIATKEQLEQVLNTGYYEKQKLAAVRVDIYGASFIYDFVIKQWRI